MRCHVICRQGRLTLPVRSFFDLFPFYLTPTFSAHLISFFSTLFVLFMPTFVFPLHIISGSHHSLFEYLEFSLSALFTMHTTQLSHTLSSSAGCRLLHNMYVNEALYVDNLAGAIGFQLMF